MIAALLNHLWQSTLFAAGVCFLIPLFHNNGASVRFWLWFAASLKFLLPFFLVVDIGHHLFSALSTGISAPILSAIPPAAKPLLMAVPIVAAPTAMHLSYLIFVLAAWFLGTTSIIAWWFSRWIRLRSALRSATELPISAPLSVKSAAGFLEPGLFGIWRPVILLPEGIVEGLTGAEIDAILAHELCHLRRQDNLLASIHMLVEALFWFHPLVWWIGARLVEERERACDERVLASVDSPLAYAQTILKVCRLCVQSPLLCASGISGADLESRVVAIMANRDIEGTDPAKQILLAIMAAMTVLAPLLAGALQTAPAVRRYHGIVAAISAPSALVRQSSTSFYNQIDWARIGAVGHAHRARRHKQITGSSNTIARSDAIAPSQVPATVPPNQETRASEVAVRSRAATTTDRNVASPHSEPATGAITNDSDAVVCRLPQQLPGSRFYGPKTCRTEAVWAQYHSNGLDVAPDGIHLISAKSWPSLRPHACPSIRAFDALGKLNYILSTVCL